MPNSVHLMDAMIGQVNGKALYAEQILQPIEPQLQRLGRELSPRSFEVEAKNLIGSNLRGFISSVQILSKAEAHLKDGQKAGLNAIVNRHREELLRQYGQGSTALAEANLYQDKGVTLAEELKRFREEQIISYYMWEKVFPLVNVTRRDIERYYNDHLADYSQPQVRQVRLLKMSGDSLAMTKIISELGAGRPFEKVASDPALNLFNPGQGGLFASKISGKPDLKMHEINAAIETLTVAGTWAGPVTVGKETWFVGLAAYDPGFNRNIGDVQLDIRNTLSAAQRKMLQEQIYAKAAEECSVSSPKQMVDTLMQIAIARYAFKPATP